MSSPRFCRIELRTTAVEAAAEFYDAAIGRPGDGIVELPATAIARGARPHWLGHIDASGLGGADEIAKRWEARGATRLGPPRVGDSVIFRDPGGAVMAVTDAAQTSNAGVAWYVLNTEDAPRAATNYAEVFGWALGDTVDAGRHGKFRQFAWAKGEPSVGSIADANRLPGIHTHWLFYFGVPSIDEAVAVVRARGGVVMGPFARPNGVKLAICDDPQGAAFGLLESLDGSGPA